jgi:hypothetical protein
MLALWGTTAARTQTEILPTCVPGTPSLGQSSRVHPDQVEVSLLPAPEFGTDFRWGVQRRPYGPYQGEQV